MTNPNRRSVSPSVFAERFKKGRYFTFQDKNIDGIDHKHTVVVPSMPRANEAFYEIAFESLVESSQRAMATLANSGGTSTTTTATPKIIEKKPASTPTLNHELVFRATKKFTTRVGEEAVKVLEAEVKSINLALEEVQRKELTTQTHKLLQEKMLRVREIACVAAGYDKFISADILAKYFPKVRDGKLGICPYGEYLRDIPDHVFDAKYQADGFFDGFVILHCMGEKELKKAGASSNEAERAVGKRDPILFGVHDGSDRMWFIDDWIDELCDLTFAELSCELAKAKMKDEPKKPLIDRIKGLFS